MAKKYFKYIGCWHRWDTYDLDAVRTCTKCGCQSRKKKDD